MRIVLKNRSRNLVSKPKQTKQQTKKQKGEKE